MPHSRTRAARWRGLRVLLDTRLSPRCVAALLTWTELWRDVNGSSFRSPSRPQTPAARKGPVLSDTRTLPQPCRRPDTGKSITCQAARGDPTCEQASMSSSCHRRASCRLSSPASRAQKEVIAGPRLKRGVSMEGHPDGPACAPETECCTLSPGIRGESIQSEDALRRGSK